MYQYLQHPSAIYKYPSADILTSIELTHIIASYTYVASSDHQNYPNE